MDFKKIIFLYVLVLGFAGMPWTYADDESPASTEQERFWQIKHEEKEKSIREIYTQLNLTDEQKKQLEENKRSEKDSKKDLYGKIRSYKEALNQELMKPELNMLNINEIQTQIKTVQAQIADDRLNSILNVRKILTVEQFTKFTELMKKAETKENKRSHGN